MTIDELIKEAQKMFEIIDGEKLKLNLLKQYMLVAHLQGGIDELKKSLTK